MERLRALRGLFACVGCMPRRTRRGSRGRVASSAPACPVTLLLQRLQDREGDRAQAYCELESALWEEDSRPPCGVANRLLAEVSQDLTAAQGATDNVRTAASNVLVALARSHFSLVMAELQGHLKAVAEMSKQFALVTLSKLFSSYAPQCVAFMWLTLAGLRCVAGQVRSGHTLRVACAVMKQWSEGVKAHLCSGKQCPWPATEKEQICENLYQLLCSVVRNWLGCEEEQDKQAVVGAVSAMMDLLLQEELRREHIWEQLLCLVHQCQEVQDTSRVTKSLDILEGVQSVIPKDTLLAITGAMFCELSEDTKQHSEAESTKMTRCILLQARICPEETVLFLQSQLGDEREARRVAALGLLGALARSDEPVMAEKLPQVAEAVQCLCGDPRTRVRRAVLLFIKDLLSADARSCSAWDVVGHIFREFSRATGRRVDGDLSAQEAQEEGALQELCVDILGSLDVAARGMTKVSHTLHACRSPSAGSELQAAALLLLQNLHSKIHRAVGAMWAAEIPRLLQCLDGKDESFPGSAEWEQRLLKFLRVSLETMADEAWTKALSCELSQWLGSSPSSSGEKSFLYKALGTALGACKEVLHIQEKLLKHLEEANAEQRSEAQGMVSLLSHAAESNFHPVLDTLTMFASRLCKGRHARISARKKAELNSPRAQATRSALILAHGSLALRASKEQLLARLERDIVGNILLLYSCSCRDLQNKLALLQSASNIFSAFQAVGDSSWFNPTLQAKLLEALRWRAGEKKKSGLSSRLEPVE
ncbi:maestro heat-like repeat-containing protein family member 2B [Numida meleagris]|uniref:maestro heat-like repeat-containing protein family member 2B n=1 Tax=Numida meleagris TaxID=8996 RepID=UPI000B3DD440|nr:maestro heat-like repeat-containing protein family member 2B [Numida meleagris]